MFEISLFWFHLAFALQYWNCYYNEYPSKYSPYTWGCLWNLHLLVRFVIFGKVSLLILNLFNSEYLDQTSMEGDGGGISSEASNWKSLFLLKIKVKQSSSCPNKEHDSIFRRVHQKIRTYPRSKKKKKNLHWLVVGKILLHIGKNTSKARHWWTS